MSDADKDPMKHKTLEVRCKNEADFPKAVARAVLMPETGAAMTCQRFLQRGESVDLMATVAEIQNQVAAVTSDDTTRMQATLISQAHTLDAIFNTLAMRAHTNFGEYVQTADLYLRLALKAQNQCRMTLESLAAIKNPPVVFAKQANISHGHQQVNNGTPQAMPDPHAHAEKQNKSNELLEVSNGERLDTRAQGKARGSDSEMETVGAINRAKKRGGKSE